MHAARLREQHRAWQSRNMKSLQFRARPFATNRPAWQCVLIAIAAIFLLSVNSAQAGLLSKISKEVGDAASGGGKTFHKALPSADDGAWFARKLPDIDNVENLALIPGENGSWRIVTTTGDELQLSSLDDLPETVRKIGKGQPRGRTGDLATSGSGKAPRIQIAIRETDFFKLRKTEFAIPENGTLKLVRANGHAHPLSAIEIGGIRRLVVELGDDVFLNPANARALDANLKFLNTNVNKGNLAVGGFDSGAGVPRSRVNQGPGAIVSLLDADILESGLAKLKNRTLLVSGKVSPDPQTGALTLAVKDKGKTRAIDIREFESAAERQRVNLVIVDSQSPAQPGSTWFSKTDIEKRFAKAQASVTQEDFLRALSPGNAKILINAGEIGGTRVTMAARFSTTPRDVRAISGTASDYSAGSWLLEAGFRSGVRAVRINAENPDHTEEVNNRWIPWVSNFELVGGGLFLLVFAYVSVTTWKWWMWFWRKIGGKRSGSDHVSRLVRVVQAATFVPFGILVFLPAACWIVLRDNLLFFSWPFRKLAGLVRKT